jgi:hypothetical protein
VHANRAAELFRVPLILNFKPEVIVGVIPKIDPRLEQWIIRMLAPEAARKDACLESEFRSNQITERRGAAYSFRRAAVGLMSTARFAGR